MKDSQKTKVIFRIFPKLHGGGVIAIFPQIACTVGRPHLCQSYQHIGQHSAACADMSFVNRMAKPSEYRELAKELRGLGYRLDIRKRATPADYRERVRQLQD